MAHTNDVIFTEQGLAEFIQQIRQNPEMVYKVRAATDEEIEKHNYYIDENGEQQKKTLEEGYIPGKGITIIQANGDKFSVAVGSDVKAPNFETEVKNNVLFENGTVTFIVDESYINIPVKGIVDRIDADNDEIPSSFAVKDFVNEEFENFRVTLDELLNGAVENNQEGHGFIPGWYKDTAAITYDTNAQDTLKSSLQTVGVSIAPVFVNNQLTNGITLYQELKYRKQYYNNLETNIEKYTNTLMILQQDQLDYETSLQGINELLGSYQSNLSSYNFDEELIDTIYNNTEEKEISNNALSSYNEQLDTLDNALITFSNEIDDLELAYGEKEISKNKLETEIEELENKSELSDLEIELLEYKRKDLENIINELFELQNNINALVEEYSNIEKNIVTIYCIIIKSFEIKQNRLEVAKRENDALIIKTQNELEQMEKDISSVNQSLQKIDNLSEEILTTDHRRWKVVKTQNSSILASIEAEKVYGAVFNDYAEYRSTVVANPGHVVVENGDGSLSLSTQRLQLGANIISDTYGFAIGKTNSAQTPIAVCGRVLAYPNEELKLFTPGAAVCSGPNGTVSIMTREEIREWPDAIIGYVSEVPTYEYWGTDNIKVDGRVWIKVA